MSFIELFLLSLSLAMDCFAVSCSTGVSQPDLKLKNILFFTFSFGFFQALMPFIGWIGGEAVIGYLCKFTYWIAFGLLAFIGGKMIVEGIRHDEDKKKVDMNRVGTVLLLSIATSIDALAVGFSFSMMQTVHIGWYIFTIGITSFIVSLIGYRFAKKLSNRIKSNYAEIIGGVVLVGIGIKILCEHYIG